MKAFDPNYKLLDEMYQDDYYPAFLVDKVKDELQKVIGPARNIRTPRSSRLKLLWSNGSLWLRRLMKFGPLVGVSARWRVSGSKPAPAKSS